MLSTLALRLNFSSAQARAQLTIITSNLIAVFNGRCKNCNRFKGFFLTLSNGNDSRSPDLCVSRLCSASSVCVNQR